MDTDVKRAWPNVKYAAHDWRANKTRMQLPSSMTLMPASRADSLACSSSAPGCIQMCFTPAVIASATIWRVTSGGVMIERDSGTSGKSAIDG